MPKYYCDYCDTHLTHDSPSVRKTHCAGRKHRDNVRIYYQKWMEEQAQHLIDVTTAAYKNRSKVVGPSGFMGQQATMPIPPINMGMTFQPSMLSVPPPPIAAPPSSTTTFLPPPSVGLNNVLMGPANSVDTNMIIMPPPQPISLPVPMMVPPPNFDSTGCYNAPTVNFSNS